MFADKQSGRDAERPELIKCRDYLRPGDTLVVPSLDRLARSLQDLLDLVGELRHRGVGFRSLHEAIDTTTPGGRLVFHIFASIAEFIRELIVEGTREGLNAARARGVRLGRPPAMTPEQVMSARTLLAEPEHSVASIARLLSVSRSTIYKYLPELKERSTASLLTTPPSQAITTGADQPPGSLPMPNPPATLECPTCGSTPSNRRKDVIEQRREELDTLWLVTDETAGDALAERRYCGQCQPTPSNSSCASCARRP